MLLAPRAYLSTFMKIGTIALLAVGVVVAAPVLRADAVSDFATSGTGPVFAGSLFPFLFLRAAGVDAAGPTRLPLHLHEDRHDRASRGRCGRGRARAEGGRGERLRHVGHRAGLRRLALPLPLPPCCRCGCCWPHAPTSPPS